MKIYRDADADVADLDGRLLAVIGYDNQGRAQALNLRDSGAQVVVGSIRDQSFDRAVADGFEPVSIAAASEQADVVLILIPDEVQPQVYRSRSRPTSRPATRWCSPTATTFASSRSCRRRGWMW